MTRQVKRLNETKHMVEHGLFDYWYDGIMQRGDQFVRCLLGYKHSDICGDYLTHIIVPRQILEDGTMIDAQNLEV